jgi:hypothetical protein
MLFNHYSLDGSKHFFSLSLDTCYKCKNVLLIERQGSVQSNEKQNTRKSEHSTIGHHKKKTEAAKGTIWRRCSPFHFGMLFTRWLFISWIVRKNIFLNHYIIWNWFFFSSIINGRVDLFFSCLNQRKRNMHLYENLLLVLSSFEMSMVCYNILHWEWAVISISSWT